MYVACMRYIWLHIDQIYKPVTSRPFYFENDINKHWLKISLMLAYWWKNSLTNYHKKKSNGYNIIIQGEFSLNYVEKNTDLFIIKVRHSLKILNKNTKLVIFFFHYLLLQTVIFFNKCSFMLKVCIYLKTFWCFCLPVGTRNR